MSERGKVAPEPLPAPTPQQSPDTSKPPEDSLVLIDSLTGRTVYEGPYDQKMFGRLPNAVTPEQYKASKRPGQYGINWNQLRLDAARGLGGSLGLSEALSAPNVNGVTSK